MSDSSWRQRARVVIAEAIAEGRAAGEATDAIVKRIDEAYPFGPRAYHPYKMWLLERRTAIAALSLDASKPADRACPTCGARPRTDCRDIETREHWPVGVYHVARIGTTAVESPDTGPLFDLGGEA